MKLSGELFGIFIGAMLVNNFTLAYFLGLCPFFGVTWRLETAFRLGLANIFVMLITSLAAWVLETFVLVHAPYLRLIAFIVVIASTVQFVEMFIKKVAPAPLPRPRHLPAPDHHQLRHPRPGAVPDQPRLRAAPGPRLRPRRRRRADAGAGADGGPARGVGALRRAVPAARHGDEPADRRPPVAGLHGLCGALRERFVMAGGWLGDVAAVAGLAALCGGWVALQAWVARWDPCQPGVEGNCGCKGWKAAGEGKTCTRKTAGSAAGEAELVRFPCAPVAAGGASVCGTGRGRGSRPGNSSLSEDYEGGLASASAGRYRRTTPIGSPLARSRRPSPGAPPPSLIVGRVSCAEEVSWKVESSSIRRFNTANRSSAAPGFRWFGYWQSSPGECPKQDVMAEYDLDREDLLAVFRYAAELIDREKVHPLPATSVHTHLRSTLASSS